MYVIAVNMIDTSGRRKLESASSFIGNGDERGQMTKKLTSASFLAILFLLFSLSGFGEQRPLVTEDVDIIKPGDIRVQFGFQLDQKQRFGLSGLSGDVTHIGDVGIYFGMSPNVEFEVTGTIRNYLNIETRGVSVVPLSIGAKTDTHDVRDFTLAAKFKLANETAYMPSLGFKFGVTLPNTDQAKGIGTNTTNAFGMVLVGKHFFNDRLSTFGNIGIAILTNPVLGTSQNDVILYGAAASVKINDRFNMVGEINGRKSTRTPFAGTESLGEARIGFQLKAAGLQWDSAFIKGYTPFSPKYGITLGVTSDIPAFKPIQ